MRAEEHFIVMMTKMWRTGWRLQLRNGFQDSRRLVGGFSNKWVMR